MDSDFGDRGKDKAAHSLHFSIISEPKMRGGDSVHMPKSEIKGYFAHFYAMMLRLKYICMLEAKLYAHQIPY